VAVPPLSELCDRLETYPWVIFYYLKNPPKVYKHEQFLLEAQRNDGETSYIHLEGSGTAN
jgi:hypothetical protein